MGMGRIGALRRLGWGWGGSEGCVVSVAPASCPIPSPSPGGRREPKCTGYRGTAPTSVRQVLSRKCLRLELKTGAARALTA